MIGGVLIAGHHVHIQHQAQVGQEEGVVGVARAAGLLGVVAEHGAFLAAVERLDGGVGVEHPALAQQRLGAVVEMALQPGHALRLVDRRQRPAHGVLAQDPLDAEQLRQHAVGPQRRHVRIALVTRQHRQHESAEHVAVGGGVGARAMERAVGHQRVEHARHLQELDEERRLPQRRQRRLRVPFDLDLARPAVDASRPPAAPPAQPAVAHPQGEPERWRLSSPIPLTKRTFQHHATDPTAGFRFIHHAPHGSCRASSAQARRR